jgi:hypothetical protein
MSSETYVVLPPNILPGENGLDATALPRATRVCKGPHKYDGTIVNNKAVGYVGEVYRREEHEFPKMLYHPKWGQKPEPEAARFMVGAITQEQMQNAMATYQKAVTEWMRSNRVKLVSDQAEAERLIKKGWLDKPPQRKDSPQFDLDSEEL